MPTLHFHAARINRDEVTIEVNVSPTCLRPLQKDFHEINPVGNSFIRGLGILAAERSNVPTRHFLQCEINFNSLGKCESPAAFGAAKHPPTTTPWAVHLPRS